ncbi:hypothetical protein AAKU55_003159 [Oxalobacteraceae bacterium GrIS 1.11]
MAVKPDLHCHQSRDYLDRCTHAVEPPPSHDEIRRQLGIALLIAERQARAERDERD